MHVLIVGEQGVGKTTLIHRIIEELGTPVWGFETKKAACQTECGFPVFIHETGKEWIEAQENLVGYCENKVRQRFPNAFDRFAEKLQLPQEGIILMDELGTLENGAEVFCKRVLELLDGETPVLAAVKYKDTAFLQAVRGHNNAKCFYLTPENRDSLYFEVLAFIKAQL